MNNQRPEKATIPMYQSFSRWIAGGCVILTLSLTLGCTPLHSKLSDDGLAMDDRPADRAFDSPVRQASAEMIEAVPMQACPERPPTELAKMSLPEYRIEPPDVLLIDAVRMSPKSPYYLKSMDLVQIYVAGTPGEQPNVQTYPTIAGAYQVEPSGMVNLGPSYGAVKIKGLTIQEAQNEITKHLSALLTSPEVSVTLLQTAGHQQIAGEHMVSPDGTINMGIYGNVYVSGMTLNEARAAIQDHLKQHLDDPEISVDVFAYNSKVYYIITEGAGYGDTVVRVPVTGNETVLDAVATVGGLQRVSSKHIWISRPSPSAMQCDQKLEVDWEAIAKGGSTATNYQLLPGDRLFIEQDRMMAFDSMVQKITSPFERVAGINLLWAQTIQAFQRFPKGYEYGRYY